MTRGLPSVPSAIERHPAFPAYRTFASDFVEAVEAALSDLEGAGEGEAADAVVRERFARFEPEYRDRMDASYGFVEPFLDDRGLLEGLHAWTARAVVPTVAPEGTILHRAFVKPRGYPGDYGVMEMAYDPTLRGRTPRDRFCHRLGLEIAWPIASRLEIAVADIAAAVEARGIERLRFLDVGCGAAPEIPRILEAAPRLRRLDAWLVDHDREALEAARARVDATRRVATATVDVTFDEASYAKLMEPPAADERERLDYVYCLGLVDYLRNERVVALLRALWARLVPGGTLLVGNMKAGTANVWPVNVMFDWRVKYRTAEDLHGWAEAVGAPSAELRLDESGRNFLLFLRK